MKKLALLIVVVTVAGILNGCDAPTGPPETTTAPAVSEPAAKESSSMLTIPRGSAVVDADLSEWAGDDVQWHNMTSLYYGVPDARDISEAKYAVRWDQESSKIYVAVKYIDTSDFRTDDFGPLWVGWDAGDRIELLSAGDGEAATGWSENHDVAQEVVVGVTKAGGAWAAWGSGEELSPDVELDYAAKLSGNKYIYEAAVKQFTNYGRFTGQPTVITELKPGHVVRFDVIVNTRHKDGFGMVSLESDGLRFNDSGKITQFELVEK